jgi:protein-S-isoprenylcysteine O-methyltransferase Ste14
LHTARAPPFEKLASFPYHLSVYRAINGDPMLSIMIWFVGTMVLASLEWRAFGDRRSSRFARFIGEVILWALLVMSAPGWFRNVLSIPHVISWALLAVSLVLALSGLHALSSAGSHQRDRSRVANAAEVSTLVTAGPFKYIRHPLHMSLVLLGWGAAFKVLSFFGILLALIATGLLYFCSYLEELENLERFGEEYDRYMENTRMFVPGVF